MYNPVSVLSSVRRSTERTSLHHVSVSLQQGYWSVLTIFRSPAAQLILSWRRERLFLLNAAIKYKLRTVEWEIKHREQGIGAGIPAAQ